MDAEMIGSLKVTFRGDKYGYAVDLIDSEMKDIQKVDQLQGMRCIHGIWEHLNGSIIKNRWKHTGLLDNYTEVSC